MLPLRSGRGGVAFQAPSPKPRKDWTNWTSRFSSFPCRLTAAQISDIESIDCSNHHCDNEFGVLDLESAVLW